MTDEFTGKVALITGGGAGIGRATALAFAEAGARTVVADIRKTAAEHVAREIEKLGAEALPVPVDIADESQVESMIETTIAELGRLDYAFNNAGVIEDGVMPLQERSGAEFDRIFGVNVKGLFNCLRHELPVMKTAGSGVIVNNASVAGAAGVGGIALYSASKHAVVGLSKSVAQEVAAQGIRVNVLLPDATRSEMLSRAGADNPEAALAMSESIPMQRLADASEQAQVVLFLCSQAASYITGAAIPCDGGRISGFNYIG